MLTLALVSREGVETTLFTFGITQTSSPLQVAAGAFLGLLGTVGLGSAVYAGAVGG